MYYTLYIGIFCYLVVVKQKVLLEKNLQKKNLFIEEGINGFTHTNWMHTQCMCTSISQKNIINELSSYVRYALCE